MIVYAVFDGDYVVGIFSNKEEAEIYVINAKFIDAEMQKELQTDPADFYVGEYEVDEML